MTVRERIIAFVGSYDGPVGADEIVDSFQQWSDGLPPDRQQVLWLLADCARNGRLVRVARGKYAPAPRPDPGSEADDLVDVRALEAPPSDARVREAKRALGALIARKRQDLEAIRDERDRYEEIILELERRLERSKPQEKTLAEELDRLERLNENAQEIFGAVSEAIGRADEEETIG